MSAGFNERFGVKSQMNTNIKRSNSFFMWTS